MNYNLNTLTFPSSDGVNTVYAEIYTPKHCTAKGIVQLSHGMIDYTGRYKELADYLTAHGYIFAGHHHLGHGKTAATRDDLGFFANEGGYDYVIRDVHTMNRQLHQSFPTLPVILLGHSMGSFIARIYATMHPHHIQGLVIHGTGGPNPMVGMGCTLAKIIKKLYGARHRSEFIRKLAFGGYNKRFPKSEGEWAWLTRDLETVKDRDTDEYTSFTFTTSAYIDLFNFLGASNSKDWFENYPKDMPTLIMSGDADPVGDYGKGPKLIYKKLMIEGCTALEMKMYEGARHELFNETNREEVFSDLVAWLDGVR